MTRSLLLTCLALGGMAAGLVGFGAWASSRMEGDWGGTPWIWLAMIGGALAVAALTIALMRLAFYSARRGYDDAVHDFRPDDTEV